MQGLKLLLLFSLAFFSPDAITLNSTLYVRCKSYERAKKKLTISEAPNVLTIALKRYQVPYKVPSYWGLDAKRTCIALFCVDIWIIVFNIFLEFNCFSFDQVLQIEFL